MSIYFIAIIHALRDPAGLAEYGRLAVPTLQNSRGTPVSVALDGASRVGALRDLVTTGTIDTIEGKPVAGVSMIRFPDKQAFEDWYYSDAYQAALRVRQASADVQVLLVEGI